MVLLRARKHRAMSESMHEYPALVSSAPHRVLLVVAGDGSHISRTEESKIIQASRQTRNPVAGNQACIP